jgi:hypothetical protein
VAVEARVWTCPTCMQTYRCPGGWQVAIFLSARRAAQYYHAELHGLPILAERRRRRSDPEPEPAAPID